ncbi:MAG: 50S ribosome-binding GTPase [Myxococcales bacterium]|nr:50S ribosome-binding GTPase [Myxococcales bacterium]MCB9718071.1 50S ribosome-binding GTPase [Myxococcales bacterium]
MERGTLVGVATGRPDGGVAIVRLSGPRAVEIAEAVAGTLPPARRLGRRRIAVEGGHEDGLVVVMPGPASFTGEDVVELHVHAGERNVQSVVRALLERGAVAAGPGGFSRRAFELGRLSLDEAEGIAAVIGARTQAALEQARRLAAGELGREVEHQRRALVELQAEIEANLDFPEDVDPGDVARWRREAQTIRAAVAGWLARFEAGRRARARARVVLAGPPNAGKSSLFNALLGRARALVAETPGTTRDYVEAELQVSRHGCVLVDTAGLREGAEAVERAGVELSRDQIEGADVVVWVEAADAEPVEETAEVLEGVAMVVRVESKRDRGVRRLGWLGVALPPDGAAHGLDELRGVLEEWFGRGEDEAWIGLARHRDRAVEAVAAIEEALGLLGEDALELAAFGLGVARTRLGEITGRSTMGAVGEEVLAEIFSRFCIGK